MKGYTTIRTVDREQLAWAAGFFDGEGFFGWIRKEHGNNKPRAGLESTDLEYLERFVGIVGVGGNLYKKRPRAERHKPSWGWQINSYERVQALAAMLWPWLGSRRKARVREILLIARKHPVSNGRKMTCPKGHPYAGDNLYREPKTGYRWCRRCRRERALQGVPRCA